MTVKELVADLLYCNADDNVVLEDDVEFTDEYGKVSGSCYQIEKVIKHGRSASLHFDNRQHFMREQEPKWIPVSERLPEDNKEVLVYVNAYPYLAWLDDGEWKTEDFIIEKDFEPIAWMPLPEPYKAERRNKNDITR